MHRAWRVGAFLSVQLAWIVVHVNAHEPDHGPAPQPPESGKAKFLQKFDKNGDGRLDEAERQAARAAHQQKMLDQWDHNDDGHLGPAERRHRQETAQRRENLVDRFDKNHDGQLGLREREALEAAKQHLDKDHDGKLERPELKRPHNAHHQHAQGGPQHPPKHLKPPQVVEKHGQGPGAVKGKK